MTVSVGRVLVRDERGMFHRAVWVGSRFLLVCEDHNAVVHTVAEIPDTVSEEQLCGFCWPGRDSDIGR